GRATALLAAAALVTASVAAGSAAVAADTPKTGLGKDGQKLTVSASAHLDPAGESIRVTGEGYDGTKGIYVAFCKDNGANRVPSPCLGGADMTGGGGASQWIVPKGDTYEGELATAYGPGGTFDVRISVTAEGDGLDCTRVSCAVVTRVDHRGSGDRSQDVRIPVAFEGQDPGDGGDGGDGVDVPAGTVSYHESASFTTAGKPLDVLLHPDSGKLYVGSDNLADTADVNEQGLYVLDPADGEVLGHIAQAPGSTGAMAGRRVTRLITPLAGDGVVFHYPLRGIGTAKADDTAARGVWLGGSTVTGAGPGTGPATVLVAQGAALSEIETATGAVRRSLTLDGGSVLGVDPAHAAAWSAGASGGQLRRVDTGSFTVTATAELPAGYVRFAEADPATGNVWVGSGSSVLVYDRDAKLLKTVEGTDEAAGIAFDTSGRRAFVVWQDNGDTGSGGDNDGSLAVYSTTTYERTAEPAALPGNHSQLGEATVAVTPGGSTVYVTSPAGGTVTKLDRRMSPEVTQAPADRSVAPGDEAAFTAAAEGAPEPTVRWQVSPDGGQTWSAVEGAVRHTYAFTATAAHDGYRYRAEFTNTAGTTRTAPVTLTVVANGGGDGGGSGGGDDEPPAGTGGSSGGNTGVSSSGSGSADGGTSGGAGGSGSGSGSGGTVGGGSADAGSGDSSLAATGVTVLSLASAAALLTGAGWFALRRARRTRSAV
ncbi:YncE family protein, partial [Streptomyces formicae]